MTGARLWFAKAYVHRLYILRNRNRRPNNTDTSSSVLNHVSDTRLKADLDVSVEPRYRPTDMLRGTSDFEIPFDAGALDTNDKRAVRDGLKPEPRVAALPPVQQCGEVPEFVGGALLRRHLSPRLDFPIRSKYGKSFSPNMNYADGAHKPKLAACL
jgi:hypothetical protein